jgi:DNA-binding NarL/FixJ family response regulator
MRDTPEPGQASAIRVLIADDDRPFLDSLQGLIERQPELSVVGAAADGLEAIELADELGPDAVVIDLHMPLLDGVTAAARLRRDHPNLCLIALTGDEAPALHKAVREAGADEVLLKTELVEGCSNAWPQPARRCSPAAASWQLLGSEESQQTSLGAQVRKPTRAARTGT